MKENYTKSEVIDILKEIKEKQSVMSTIQGISDVVNSKIKEVEETK